MNTDDAARIDGQLETGRDSSSANYLGQFDEQNYRPYLDGLDLTDDQANELLRIVWDIMRIFVEMDMPAENWGQILGSIIQEPTPDPAEVD